uniref:Immunoglobulin V-set domain-containing protein n=1 Tax=Chelonoidis abingdonii TaxID=106734 RepID=A0A8C0HCQ8_CHEAB
MASWSGILPWEADAKVIQTSRLVLERGQTAYLRREQTYGYYNMFWYRQDLGQGLQLLFYIYHKEEREKGTSSSQFQADQPQDDLFHLNISSTEHSAVYFCASSLDTVLQSHLLPLQKPSCFPQHSLRESRSSHLHTKRRTCYYQAERNSLLFIETTAKSCWGRSKQRQTNSTEY